MKKDAWTWILGLFGAVNVANGAWMIADPSAWYTGIPAAVPDFGPLNEHFVRDVGAAYVTCGAALVWAGLRPAARAVAVGIASIFFVLHAAAHVYDTARGFVGPEHWWIDFPAVHLPAILLVAAWFRFARGGGGARA